MKLGLIGRCDNRGIGYQTLEFARHMKPDRTLVVLLNDPAWPEDSARFSRVGGDVHFANSDLNDRLLDERKVRKFLDGLDVVFAVETLYDWRMADWAREMGVCTVVQGNPEFYTHHMHRDRPHPDEWVWPTDWMLDDDTLPNPLPAGDVLPVPCVRRANIAADPDDDTFRILHVGGHAAAGDRNGTMEFIEAIRSLRARVHVTITSQDGVFPRVIQHGRNVTVDAYPNGFADRWDMYRNQHLVVLPRKYGGLCIPALEAMACGVAVMMPDCSPNATWPGPRVPSRRGRRHRTPYGAVQMFTVHPLQMAQHIDRLANNREMIADEMELAWDWANLNAWDDLGPMLYDDKLRR